MISLFRKVMKQSIIPLFGAERGWGNMFFHLSCPISRFMHASFARFHVFTRPTIPSLSNHFLESQCILSLYRLYRLSVRRNERGGDEIPGRK